MRRVLVLFIVCMMSAGQITWALGAEDGDDHRAVTPFSEVQTWSDDFSDTSKVYIPTGGLVGVEVVGGEVRLKAGETEGWIASEVITCPEGFRYDHVLLDASIPTNSSLSISMLNASRPGSANDANATIPGFNRTETTDLSLTAIWPGDHPNIRLQANLIANGTQRPRLSGWTLYFIEEDTWQEDFSSFGRISYTKNLNITKEDVEVNLTVKKKTSDLPEYQPYPSIFYCSGGNSVSFYGIHPNAEHTSYQDPITIPANCPYWMEFDDLDEDGDLDMVLACYESSTASYPAEIRWGAGTDPWSSTEKTVLNTVKGSHFVRVGDFNGDGGSDLLFAGVDSYGTCLYFNQGKGEFNSTPDVTGSFVSGTENNVVGDIDNDGYLDTMRWTHRDGVFIYYGGPDGPDPDVYDFYDISGVIIGTELLDIDQDGYLDMCVGKQESNVKVYCGGSNGFSTEPDYVFTIPTDACYEMDCGDINGDGFTDLNIRGWTYNGPSSGNTMCIFMGSASGWNRNPDHAFFHYRGTLFDVNKDGYDDIVGKDHDNRKFIVCYGGEDWDSTPDIEKAWIGSPLGPLFCVPKQSGSPFFRGTLVTEVIDLPPGKNWDLLYLDLDIPSNTTFFVSVTDAENNTIEGFDPNAKCCLDLSPIVDKRAIRVVVTLASELNNTTPVLRQINLKWMDKRTWRDEFYGSFRIDRSFATAVTDFHLIGSPYAGTAPQLLLASLRNDMGYLSMSQAHFDAGDVDYGQLSPMAIQSMGAMAASTGDINGDGLLDMAFASYQVYMYDFISTSLVFLGTPVGFRDIPDFSFNTTGARDVLLDDLNGDGHIDLVFAQEQDGYTFAVDSLLFWGSKNGFNQTPDLKFKTKGASGVIAVDLDGDDLKDLVFACYRDKTTATDSMVFLQEAAGFCATTPDHRLPTHGARAVAAGHLNGDGLLDLVFANSEASSSPKTDSYIYHGKEGGGFSSTPLKLPTLGAQDVKVADLDNDGDADIVFANHVDASGDHEIASYVYLRGAFGFLSVPDHTLPTEGAMGVSVCDLDGTGWKDLVFACHQNRTSYEVESFGYLGGASGWSSGPDIAIPTKGASDVVVAHLLEAGHGGYMSMPITPEDPHKTGTFHTLRYTASLQGTCSGTLHIYDALTWEVLASTPIKAGQNEWLLRDLLYMKENPSIRIVADLDGLDHGSMTLDDLWVNWTPRVERPPMVRGIDLAAPTVLRLSTVDCWLNVSDEYDPPKDLSVQLEHRLEGETRWVDWMVANIKLEDGRWRAEITPGKDCDVGIYHFRVLVWDSDDMNSGWTEVEGTLEVLNNPPSRPEITLGPLAPTTESTLQVSIIRSGTDREGGALSLRFHWFKNGAPITDLTGDRVPPERTSKGQNWSVEVRAFDGDDEGPPATAWVVIRNSPPVVKGEIPEPTLDEDTEDTSIEMWRLFTDPDGDTLEWMVNQEPEHISVEIDPDTGLVTLTPDIDWFGEETLTFTASDGEYSVEATVIVTVNPVNDLPRFVTVNGEPLTGDAVTINVLQDGTLVLVVGAEDREGDELVFSIDTDLVELNTTTGELRYTPGNEDIGSFQVVLTMSDAVSPEDTVELTITIIVGNVNDPPATPRITRPTSTTVIEVNDTVTFEGISEDPDELHGQTLTYSWSSDVSGHLGDGRVLEVTFTEAGAHTITLTVSDGEHQVTSTIQIQVNAPEPPPPPEPPKEKKEDESPGFGVLALTMASLVAIPLAWRRRRKGG